MQYWIAAIAIAFSLLTLGAIAGDQCPDGLAPIEGGADPLDNGGCAPLPPPRP